MEPFASSLASIIGLIGQFKSGRDSVKSASFDEFMQWLAESNHADLRSLIESNHTTTISIKAILNQSQGALKASLERIDNALAAITTALDGFAQLSQSLNPNALLSDQAVGILQQIDKLGASKVLLVQYLDTGDTLIPIDGNGGQIHIPEPRFLEGDLLSLTEAKLLIPGRNSHGRPMWTFTRAAAGFVATLNERGEINSG
ncbi:hypothetical protein SA496_14145 [Pseudomonas sp. JS3066]|uniref:hypothetical protein n=1 Tax=Pseudomonas sp. JS3066 TaxID=3090665 RepID=UPI002E7B88B2|nr:hypothetical protein [Pseudomonas sp. JS3066]WVK96246.1 hypothetical protein SA496_14145 [Pseudomonas sp. JS3066]